MNRVAGYAMIFVAAAIGVFIATLLLRSGSETLTVEAIDLDGIYNPAQSGENLPNGFRELLPRDTILPIYDPHFVSATESPWHDDALVVGLEVDGDARAYPVSFLNRREIVNDHVGKTPVLVTW
jgi:hypothetical protein